MYSCKRCGYNSEFKSNLTRHLRKRVPCKAELEDIPREELLGEVVEKDAETEWTCPICHDVFHSRSSMYRHKRSCKAKTEQKEKHRIEELESRLQELENTTTHHTHIHQTVNNVNQGTINNITINAVGKEDIGYLTEHPKFQEFMVRCIRDRMEGVCNYLVKKHFDPAHPENHNLKKLNKKDDFMEVFDGRKWKLRYSEDILEDIFENIQKDFADFVDQAFTENGKMKKVWMDNFMKQVGSPLDWDLSNEMYEFQGEVNDDTKRRLRNKIYKLACEYIYRHSKEIDVE